MAQLKSVSVGLDKLHAAILTEQEDGTISYGEPKALKGITEASLTPSTDSASVYADDTVHEILTVISQIDVSLSLVDLTPDEQAFLLGKTIDENGVLLETANDEAPYVALMFRSRKANGEYRYITLHKGRFTPGEEAFNTKGEGTDYQTRSITGSFVKRNDGVMSAKADSDNPKSAAAIKTWFDAPYEPKTTVDPGNGE